jgi:hypothetical protein
VLIDTAKSFVHAESELKGVLMAISCLDFSPNLTSCFTPETLISSYEVFEAMRRGVAVPFRKRDAENLRNISELKACDKGWHDLPAGTGRQREGSPDRFHPPSILLSSSKYSLRHILPSEIALKGNI